jgi:hypothetical protein
MPSTAPDTKPVSIDAQSVSAIGLAAERFELAPITPETGDRPALRPFTALAYSGAVVDRSFGPMVIDLAGIKLPTKRLPLMFRHGQSGMCDDVEDPRMGHIDTVTLTARGVEIAGVLYAHKPHVAAAMADADHGFPWQMSVGIDRMQLVRLAADETREVNGRTLGAPLTVCTASTLREVSLVELGADGDTEMQALGPTREARRGNLRSGVLRMLRQLGITAGDLAPQTTPAVVPAAVAGLNADANAHHNDPTPHEDTLMPTDTTPAPAPATVAQLKALPGAEAQFILDAVEGQLTVEAAAVKLCGVLAGKLEAADKTVDTSAIETLTKERDALKLRLDESLKAGGAKPLTSPESGAVAGPFPGALGKDPEADWTGSEALRAEWKNSKRGFLMYAREQQRVGQSWLTA